MPDFKNPEIVGAIIALVGVALGVISTWILTFINRHYDDRRHLRQLAIETAVTYWKQDIETAHVIGKLTQTDQGINPLDTYIVHMLMLADVISGKKLNRNNIAEELLKVREASKAAAKAAKQTI